MEKNAQSPPQSFSLYCNIDHVFVKQQYKKIISNILSQSESVEESDELDERDFCSLFFFLASLNLSLFLFCFILFFIFSSTLSSTAFLMGTLLSTIMSRRRAGYLVSAVRR